MCVRITIILTKNYPGTLASKSCKLEFLDYSITSMKERITTIQERITTTQDRITKKQDNITTKQDRITTSTTHMLG